MATPRKWFVEIVQGPKVHCARFGYVSATTGTVVWATVPWLMPEDARTGDEALNELYAALLQMAEQLA